MSELDGSSDRCAPIKCLMIGVGEYTFVDDWASAASSVSQVYGMRSMPDHSVWKPNPTVVTVASSGAKRYEVHTVRVRGGRWAPRLAESLGARAIVAVAREIENVDGPIDLIHSHFYSASAGVPRAARLLGVPYIHTEHSSSLVFSEKGRAATRPGLKILRRVAADASRLFVVSEFLHEAMVAHGIDARYEVLENPVDASLFSARPVDTRRPAHLVTVGTLAPHKRHELLIRSFAQIVETQPDATLTIVGVGPLRLYLEALSGDLGVSSRVRFVGWLDRVAVARELRSADVYVHGSAGETFGVSIVEALLSGTPVVSTACGGVLESMPPSLPVRVVESASPEVFAGAVRATLAEGAHLDRDQVAATAAALYGLDNASRRLRVAYESAVSG